MSRRCHNSIQAKIGSNWPKLRKNNRVTTNSLILLQAWLISNVIQIKSPNLENLTKRTSFWDQIGHKVPAFCQTKMNDNWLKKLTETTFSPKFVFYCPSFLPLLVHMREKRPLKLYLISLDFLLHFKPMQWPQTNHRKQLVASKGNWNREKREYTKYTG